MKLDVTREFKDLYGEAIQDVSKDDNGVTSKKPLTVRAVLISALVTSVQGTSIKAEEQVGRFILAHKVVSDDEIELSAEQVTNIKKWVAVRYAPMITGQICLLLEEKLDELIEGEQSEPGD